MATSFKFNTKGIALFNPKTANKKMQSLGRKFFASVLPEVQKNIRFQAPVGATSFLRNGIDIELSSPFRGRVFSGMPYSLVIEKGRKAKPVSAKADPDLVRWLRATRKGRSMLVGVRRMMLANGRKKVSTEQVIRSALFLLKRSLKKKKRKANPFFQRGIYKSKSFIKKATQLFTVNMAKALATK